MNTLIAQVKRAEMTPEEIAVQRRAAAVARKANVVRRVDARKLARALAQLDATMISGIAVFVAGKRQAAGEEFRAAMARGGPPLPKGGREIKWRAVGQSDQLKRWQPSPAETADCCAWQRMPHAKYPWSFRAHCRSRAHLRELIRAAMRGREVSPDVAQVLFRLQDQDLLSSRCATVAQARNVVAVTLEMEKTK